MMKQILKSKKGKWAVALVAVAVLGTIGSISKGSTEALAGAAILVAIAGLLVLSQIKKVKNPPSLNDMGIYVPEAALLAFDQCGTLPDLNGTPVMLENGEQAVYDCSAIRTETKNRVVGHTKTARASVRLTKSVTVRAGGGDRSIYGDVKTSSAGRLIVTTKKIVFSSQQKAFTAQLSEIDSVETYDDGMTIIAGKYTYVLEMAMPHYPAAMIEQCRKMTL